MTDTVGQHPPRRPKGRQSGGEADKTGKIRASESLGWPVLKLGSPDNNEIGCKQT